MCPAASETTLGNIPEDQKSALHCAGRLRSRKKRFFLENGKDNSFPTALALIYQTARCHNL
jgi:hypothetical protein